MGGASWSAPAERSGDGAFAGCDVIGMLAMLLPKAVSRFACHRSPKYRGLRGLRFWPGSGSGARWLGGSFLEKIIQHTQISIDGVAGFGTKVALELP